MEFDFKDRVLICKESKLRCRCCEDNNWENLRYCEVEKNLVCFKCIRQKKSACSILLDRYLDNHQDWKIESVKIVK